MRDATVPLIPRRHVHGSPIGDMRSGRRGDGSEIVGLREYRRGDDPRRIDHRTTARLSRARGDDVLLVREFYAEEAARVVLVLDRRASMQLFPPDLPWLQKAAAVREIVRLVADSALEARSPVGCLQLDGHAQAEWWAPLRRPRTSEWLEEPAAAPPGSLASALGTLAKVPRLGKGTFVFVVSDFLEPPDEQDWWRLLARGWDPVPVVVQDPVWEQSFPDLGGTALPVAAAGGARRRLVRVSRREARALREAHAGRLASLLAQLRALTLEPICVGDAHPLSVQLEFRQWAAARGGRLR
jgi:uncharacterized protein (DUF58 family)